MPIRLRYFGACEQLDHLRASINAVFEATVARAASELQLGSIDVFVTAEIWRSKSKTLIYGFAMSDREVIMRVNPAVAPGSVFELELAAILAHEFNHCRRWAGPGYGMTLREAIVSEGLACHYETGFRGGALPEYVPIIPSAVLLASIPLLTPFLDQDKYDRAMWFDGRKGKIYPPYFGYSLGYYLVQKIIDEKSVSVADLCCTPAADFWAGLSVQNTEGYRGGA